MIFICLHDPGLERLPIANEDWIPVVADNPRSAGLAFAREHLDGFGRFTVHVRPIESKVPCMILTLEIDRMLKR